jgi:hypothetical protein
MESVLKYPRLFEPIVLAGQLFRNRIFSSPQGYYNVGPECYPNGDCVAFFERKAKGGVASVCLGDCIVDGKTGTHYPFLMRIDEPDSLPASRLCHACQAGRRRLGGAVPRSMTLRPSRKGRIVYGPVDMEGPYGPVREMPEAEICRIIECYGRARPSPSGRAAAWSRYTEGTAGFLRSSGQGAQYPRDKWGAKALKTHAFFPGCGGLCSALCGAEISYRIPQSGSEGYEAATHRRGHRIRQGP